MNKQIPLEEALKLVSFASDEFGNWWITSVNRRVYGDVKGGIKGNVHGSVDGNIRGTVAGTINGSPWEFVETPKEKLKRLIEEDADTDRLMEAFNQL